MGFPGRGFDLARASRRRRRESRLNVEYVRYIPRCGSAGSSDPGVPPPAERASVTNGVAQLLVTLTEAPKAGHVDVVQGALERQSDEKRFQRSFGIGDPGKESEPLLVRRSPLPAGVRLEGGPSLPCGEEAAVRAVEIVGCGFVARPPGIRGLERPGDPLGDDAGRRDRRATRRPRRPARLTRTCRSSWRRDRTCACVTVPSPCPVSGG